MPERLTERLRLNPLWADLTAEVAVVIQRALLGEAGRNCGNPVSSRSARLPEGVASRSVSAAGERVSEPEDRQSRA